MWSDVRYSLRSLRRSRALSLSAIGVLAIPAALAIAVFAVVDAVLLRPVPVRSPEQLRYLYSWTNEDEYSGINHAAYERLQPLSAPGGPFQGVAVAGRDRARVTRAPGADVAMAGEVVSGNYFALLGVGAMLGRTLTPSDDEHASEPVAVISESVFASHYSSDPAILGTGIRLEPRARGATSEQGRVYTIVGVIRGDFRGLLSPLEASEYWVPIRPRAADYSCHDREYLSVLFLTGIGRLRDAEGAHTALPARVTALADPAWIQRGRSVTITADRRVNLPFGGDASAAPKHGAYAAVGVCLVLLAIGTTNLVGLLFAHNLKRQQEFAVRLLLGARRRRVISMVVLEGALLAILGCAAGLVLAAAITQAFTASIPLDVAGKPLVLQVDIGRRAALAALAAALVTAAAIALPTAWHLLRHSASGLVTAPTATPRHVRSRLRWMVFPQVALSVTLVTLGGALVQTLAATEPGGEGYDAAGVTFLEFAIPAPGRCHRQNRGTMATYVADSWRTVGQLQAAARMLPGITLASTTMALPHEFTARAAVLARDVNGSERTAVAARLDVGAHFFSTMGIPLLQGRGFDGSDGGVHGRVAVISRRLANDLWPGGHPVGETIGIRQGGGPEAVQWVRVVGVAGDIAPVVHGSPPRAVYLSIEQTGWVPRLLLVRHDERSAAPLRQLSEVARRVDPRVEIYRASTVEGALMRTRYPRRVATGLLVTSGLAGMALAGIGLFGLLGYVVRQRTREIGIRTALGATERSVTALVVKEALAIGIPAALVGITLAVGISRLAPAWGVPLSQPDAAVLIGVAAVMSALVGSASYVPARRAMLVDPVTVLKAP